MRYQSKAFINCCLLGTAITLGLASCSSSPTKPPENNLAAQTTPSPVATIAPSPTIEDLTPPPPVPDTAVAGSSSVNRPGTASRSNAVPSRRNVAPAPAPAPQPRSYTLPSGTAISISTETDLSSKKNKGGDRFTGSLESDLVSGDYTIARRGSPVEGVVVETDPGGRVSGVASMTVKLDSLTLSDGRRVKLSTSSYTKEA